MHGPEPYRDAFSYHGTRVRATLASLKKIPSGQEGRTIMRWLPQSASATCQTSTMP